MGCADSPIMQRCMFAGVNLFTVCTGITQIDIYFGTFDLAWKMHIIFPHGKIVPCFFHYYLLEF